MAKLRLRWPRLRRLVEGTPTILILHSKLIPQHLRREGLDEETLMTALREHGISEISEVEMAVLEIDGSISVVPVGSETKRVRKPFKTSRYG